MSAKKLSKRAVAAIVSVAGAALLISALLIINIFYPLRYFTAYIVGRERPAEDEFSLTVLDVGQADCAVACLPGGKTLLVDGGDGAYLNTLKILTELNRRDIDFIDYVVCTSVDDEYCGGLGEILRNKAVGAVFMPWCANRRVTDGFADLVSAAEELGVRTEIAEYGAGVDAGDFFFTFLSPAMHGSPDSEYADLNSDPSAENIAAASAVMWLEYAGAGMVYAGGTSGEKLSEIADAYLLTESIGDPDGYFTFCGHEIELSACAAYKAAGHASPDSRSAEFVSLISPEYSFISVGENNGSGCPSVAVMADLYACGEVFITMYDGDITFTVGADGDCSAACAEN